jgi:ketosteroid isomerase-like protein
MAFVLIALPLAVLGCATPRSSTLTEAQDREIRDTIMALEDAMNLAVDGLDCRKGMLTVGDREPVFVSNGWVVRNKAALQTACETMVAPRTGATFAVDTLSAHALSPEAAYVVREGAYTINYRDRPPETLRLIMTTVWALQNGEWKMVHLHESFPVPASR